jgi:hypothetical protein
MPSLLRALAVLGVLAIAGPAWGRITPAETHVEAAFDVASRSIVGDVELRITNVTPDAITSVPVWLYANRFKVKSAAVDQINFYWVYPREFNPGWTVVRDLIQEGEHGVRRNATGELVPHALAGRDTLLMIALPEAVQPGEAIVLHMAFQTRVPERYGAFGCIDGDCTLAGGAWPQLAQLDEAGFDLEAPPAVSDVSGEVVLSAPADVVIAGRFLPRARRLPLVGRATHLPIRVAPHFWRSEGVRDGVHVLVLERHPPPPADDAEHQTVPYTAEDYGRMTLSSALEAVEVLGLVGLGEPDGTRVTLVESPLRTDLALAEPGVVYVSDRAFRIVPSHSFRKFHAREIVRAIYAELLERRPRLTGVGARDATLEPEAAAAFLLDLFTLRQYQKSEFAQNLLAPVSFIPAVDQLLYAPQVAFAGAYFGSIADRDAFRDGIRRFNNLRPRGGVYYEKLRNLLPAVVLGDTMRDVALGKRRLIDAARAHSGKDLDWFFAQWSGRPPRVDYRLGEISVRKIGERFRHRIAVIKQQVAAERVPVEPVEVRVVDDEDHEHTLRWEGDGPRGVVELDSDDASLELVQLDPRHRLIETTPAGSADDPLFNDRWPPRWKFLYNQFGLLVGSDGTVEVNADFSFRRVNDNRNLWRMAAFSNSQVLAGGSVAYSRRFGPKVLPNRPLNSLSLSLGGQRLTPGVNGSPGSRVSLGVGFSSDDRVAAIEPFSGEGILLGAHLTLTRFDDVDDAPRAGDVLVTGGVGADYTRMFTPLDGHTLVLAAEAGLVFGDIGARSQLLGPGGQGGLRGYGGTTLFGRSDLIGHIEWRGNISHTLDINVGHLAWWRNVNLAGFIDAGVLSSCDGIADFEAGQAFYASAGFGLRAGYDMLGIQGGFLGIDVAVPLVRQGRECLDVPAEVMKLPPLLIYLNFIPPFA